MILKIALLMQLFQFHHITMAAALLLKLLPWSRRYEMATTVLALNKKTPLRQLVRQLTDGKWAVSTLLEKVPYGTKIDIL